MELYEIKNGLDKAHLLIDEYRKSAQIDEKLREIEGLSYQTMQDGFWDDPTKAKKIYDELNDMKKITDEYENLCQSLNSLDETYTLVKETDDQEFQTILESDYQDFEQRMSEFEKILLLSGKYDSANAIVEIHPGAGGTESQDWASMLMRMYMRWAESNGYKLSVANLQEGDEAGIKTVTMNIEGSYAYGYLKGENGVHRLVRVSPYNAQGKRMTSFASVFVTPLVDDSIEVTVEPARLSWDTFRSGGAGGQNVNKVESGVRLRYQYKDPYTGEEEEILIENTETRDQPKNKENAMRQLRSILYDKELQHRMEEQAKVEAGKKKIEWGSQIRSYVFDDRRMKDHRTNYQTSDVNGVMDGKIDGFIKAYLMEFSDSEI